MTNLVHVCGYSWSTSKLQEETERLGSILKQELGLELADLNEDASRMFKATYVNPNRLGPMIREDAVLKGVGSDNE